MAFKQFWKFRWKRGSKNRSWRRRGVDFFWNNPLLISFVCLLFFFSFPNWLLSLLSFFCGHKLASAVRGSTIHLYFLFNFIWLCVYVFLNLGLGWKIMQYLVNK